MDFPKSWQTQSTNRSVLSKTEVTLVGTEVSYLLNRMDLFSMFNKLFNRSVLLKTEVTLGGT